MNNELIKISDANRAKVRKWMEEHLCGTQTECAKALGLGLMTVNKHVRTIRDEWRSKKPRARRIDERPATSA